MSCPRILSPSVALGYWYHSHVNTSKSCHAHVQNMFGHLSTICSQFTFYHVGHPWFNLVHHSAIRFTSNIFDVSCRWWGIHHGPPSMIIFLSTSTPYPRIRLRNQVKYLGPACLNGRLPHFQHEFISLSLDWNILPSLWLKILYSQSGGCVKIP